LLSVSSINGLSDQQYQIYQVYVAKKQNHKTCLGLAKILQVAQHNLSIIVSIIEEISIIETYEMKLIIHQGLNTFLLPWFHFVLQMVPK
jgi:hypothetical protein